MQHIKLNYECAERIFVRLFLNQVQDVWADQCHNNHGGNNRYVLFQTENKSSLKNTMLMLSLKMKKTYLRTKQHLWTTTEILKVGLFSFKMILF